MKQRGRKSASQRAMDDEIAGMSGNNFAETTGDPAPPPPHLSPPTQAWWRDLVHQAELQPRQLRTLQAAGEAWDRYQQARQELAVHGLTYVDAKGMIRARPECAIERARVAFVRCMRELGLDKPPPKEPRDRNPGLGITWRQLDRR